MSASRPERGHEARKPLVLLSAAFVAVCASATGGCGGDSGVEAEGGGAGLGVGASATAGSAGVAAGGQGAGASAGAGGIGAGATSSGGVGGIGGAAGAGATCNGRADLCDRPYDEVAQACTHNAMSSTAYGFLVPTPNQRRSFTDMLDDGVRCLMLDLYEWLDDTYLCHGSCLGGSLKLSDGLDEIAAWLSSHPSEVVTLILESYVTPTATYAALVAAGLADPSEVPAPGALLYFHDAPAGSPWPTLGEMIETSQRLVVFTDSGGNESWHLDWQTYGWETPYDDPTFSCSGGRGDPTAYANQIFILNHYSLGSLGGDETISAGNNAFDVAREHAVRCWQTSPTDNPWGHVPTFVNVDHYHVPTAGGPSVLPDVLDVVDALNDAWPTAPAP